MALFSRIIGLCLLAAGLGALLGFAFFGKDSNQTIEALLIILLACVGGIIGAVAGATREIVAALRKDTDN